MMRVTRNMIKESKRRAGDRKTSSVTTRKEKDGRLSPLKGRTTTANTVQRNSYEKLESSSARLVKKADVLSAKGEDSLFRKAGEGGEKQKIADAAKEFVAMYNETLTNVKKAPGVLNEYYYKMLKEVASDNAKALEGIGITIGRDGSLDLNERKFLAAETDTLEKVLGGSDSFVQKTSFVAGRISDNAQSNLDSMSGRYNSAGLLQSALAGRYNFRG